MSHSKKPNSSYQIPLELATNRDNVEDYGSIQLSMTRKDFWFFKNQSTLELGLLKHSIRAKNLSCIYCKNVESGLTYIVVFSDSINYDVLGELFSMSSQNTLTLDKEGSYHIDSYFSSNKTIGINSNFSNQVFYINSRPSPSPSASTSSETFTIGIQTACTPRVEYHIPQSCRTIQNLTFYLSPILGLCPSQIMLSQGGKLLRNDIQVSLLDSKDFLLTIYPGTPLVNFDAFVDENHPIFFIPAELKELVREFLMRSTFNESLVSSKIYPCLKVTLPESDSSTEIYRCVQTKPPITDG